MKKPIQKLMLMAAAMGALAVLPSTITAHADNQFYSVPDANQNVQQINSGNALADYSDSDLTMLNNTTPNVGKTPKYIHTKLNMKGNNPLDTYNSTDGSNSFSTYFYLPEGFHVQYGEHGNYQSTVLVGDNLYIVESMGTGKNQGAIIKYNLNDLKKNGIFDGNQDLIWKALNYFSPYTVSGNQHSTEYLRDTTNIQNAQQTIASAKKQISILNQQIKPLSSQIKRLKTPNNKAIKAQSSVLVTVTKQQKALDNQLNFINQLKAANDAKNSSGDGDDNATTSSSSAVDSSSSSNDSSDDSSAGQVNKPTKVVNDVTNDNYAQFAKKQANQINQQNAALKKLLKQNPSKKNVKQINTYLAYNAKLAPTLKALVKTINPLFKQYQKANGALLKKQNALKNVNAKISNWQQKSETSQNLIDDLEINNADADQYARLAHLAQISPLINIGHGQTLSYNPANQHLYLAQDDSNGDLTPDQNDQVTELDSNSLQPLKQYTFKLLHNNVNYQIRTLTFDSQGNAYIGRNYSNKNNYQILKGQFNDNGVSFATEKTIINRPGYYNQGISYNAANNRMYIISDDALTSVPTDELNNGTVSPDDIHYLTFSTSREFEDVTFDSQGYGYLLMLWKPEILKSQNPLN